MAKFRKKPVVIEAVPASSVLDATPENRNLLPDWLLNSPDIFIHCGVVEIRTLEGVMAADRRDWIIRGVKGELYPCKSDIFEATYDEVQ